MKEGCFQGPWEPPRPLLPLAPREGFRVSCNISHRLQLPFMFSYMNGFKHCRLVRVRTRTAICLLPPRSQQCRHMTLISFFLNLRIFHEPWSYRQHGTCLSWVPRARV